MTKQFFQSPRSFFPRHAGFGMMCNSALLAGGLCLLGVGALAMPFVFPTEQPVQGNALVRGPVLQLTHVYLDKKPVDSLGNFYYMLGTQMAARGQILAAESLLSKAVVLLPHNADAFLNYGVVLEALDRNQEALGAYQKASVIQEATPDGINAQTLYTIGLLQDKMGKTDLGIQTLLTALKLEPKNNLIAYDLGVLYSKQESFEDAARYSKLAIDGLEDFAEGYNNYGYALAHLGRYDEALKAVNRSLELKPESAAALDSRGFVFYGMGKYSESLAEYKKALAMDPTIGEIYLHIGETYEKQKDYGNAIRAYEQYIQLTPKASNVNEVRARMARLKQLDFAQKGPVDHSPALNAPSMGRQTVLKEAINKHD